MDCTGKRVPLLLLLTLLAHLERAATCCTRGSGSCNLDEPLCRSDLSRLNNDGVGKRKMGDRRFQNRLQQLLHGSRNQAAGILTMGKRLEDNGHRPLLHADTTTSAPVNLGLERPLKCLMATVREEAVYVDAYEKRGHVPRLNPS